MHATLFDGGGAAACPVCCCPIDGATHFARRWPWQRCARGLGAGSASKAPSTPLSLPFFLPLLFASPSAVAPSLCLHTPASGGPAGAGHPARCGSGRASLRGAWPLCFVRFCCGPRLWLGWAQRRPGREGVGSPPLAGGNAWVVAAAWAGGWWAASLTSRRALRVQLFPPLVSLWLCAGLADGRVDSLVALVGPIAGRTGVVQALERLDNSCVLHLTAPNVPQVRLVVKPDALSSVGGYAVLERVCDVFLGFLFIYFASVAQRGASPPTAMPASHTFVCCPGTAYHLLLGNNSR